MVNSKDIYIRANKVVKDAGTRNASAIAADLGISLYYQDDFTKLLGMYAYSFRKRAIFVNNRLDEHMTAMVIAHEIGHDILHRNLAKGSALKEFELFNLKDTTEYEANAFAAHLLIDTDEFVELAREGRDVTDIAATMNTHINLALIKLQELIKLGYDLRMPMEVRGDFLRKIEV